MPALECYGNERRVRSHERDTSREGRLREVRFRRSWHRAGAAVDNLLRGGALLNRPLHLSPSLPGVDTVGRYFDVLRSAGLRYAWYRVRQDGHQSALRAAGRQALYHRIWTDAAAALDATIVDLGHGFLEIQREGVSTRVWERHVMLDDAVTLRLAFDKRIVTRLLTAAGLPTPEQLEFDPATLGPAESFLADHPGACVVKPASGTGGGAGVTTGVRAAVELRRASRRAARFDTRLVIERQAEGSVFRLLFLDGELLDVVRRGPPTVTGNGREEIRDLIIATDRRRALDSADEGVEPLAIDDDSVITLALAGMSLRTRPGPGVAVPVKTATNQNGPMDNEAYRGALSDALVADAARAASVLRLRLAGVDVVTRDPAVPLAESGGVLIEVNGAPGLHHHYHVQNPKAATPVAVAILHRLLGDSQADYSEPTTRRSRLRELSTAVKETR